MNLQTDLAEIPKGVKIGAIVGVAVVVLGLIVFAVMPKKSAVVEKLKPPPGYPDVPPYNTRAWQEMQKRVGGGGPPMGMPPGGAPAPGR